MPIKESDISIVIPTYKYRDKIGRAVRSALASGAGEIIVVDDCGKDGTIEMLSEFSDSRLIVHENERNLGLWENHLNALGMATKPWIKFIQADDYLLVDGLAAYAAAAETGVSVVWAVPTVIDDATGKKWFFHFLREPIRVCSRTMQDICLSSGWILGSPSHMMLRSDVIERDSSAWRTGVSADVIVGSIAAARGDVVLLPAGPLAQGAHPLQDAKTQGALLGLKRSVRTIAFLRNRDEEGLRRFANHWAILNVSGMFRTTLRGLISRDVPTFELLYQFSRLITDFTITDWRSVVRDRVEILEAMRCRRRSAMPIELDSVFQALACAKSEVTA
ncbi:glycosyltransferase family 2 protein [Mesorhizobium sp. M1273]|uniref:glycosyltransferase family 2 protein n=1 Tax=Mesorhizobium sp. M1273 TaxID=2957075 RepID=UPI003339DDEB